MSEGDGGPKRDGSCTLCQDCGDAGDGANFCTACGRQLKPVSNRQLKCRSAESSEQTAWRVFGFANACSTERTPGKTASGITAHMQTTDGSLRSTGIKAVKAIRKKIVNDCAPATSDQARVMGVEPVIERMGLDLSIEQLQVLALARSSALCGRRRRHSPSRFQEQRLVLATTNPISTAGEGIALQYSNSGRRVERRARINKASFERSSSSNCFSGRGGKNKRSRRGDRNPANRNRTSQEVSLKTTPRASHQRGASSSIHRRGSTTAAESIKQLRQREPETREQLLAMARGGLRYRQMVFHRKGFRLTDESPRGVRPREAFRKPGFHPLCSKEIVVAGEDGSKEVFTAILSAIVRIMETKNTGAFEDVDPPRLDMRGQIHARSPHGVPHDEVYGCEGLRLEVRPKRPRDTSTDNMASDTLDTSSLPPGSTGHIQCTNHIFRRGVMRNLVVGPQENENDGKGDHGCSLMKSSRSIEDCPDQDQSMALRGGLPRAATSFTGARRLDSATTNDAPFVEDLLHSEIGALLGQTLFWSDPFEEEKTVDELKGTWTACLEALCRRLRITIIFPEVREGHNSPSCSNAEAMPPETLSLATFAITAPMPSAIAPVTRAPLGLPTNDCSTPREKIVGGDYAPLSPTNDGAIVGIVTPARSEHCVYGGLEVENNHIPGGCDSSVCDQDSGQYVLEHAAREDHDRAMVCFDKVLVRVGVRIPWGRRKRKRFAKVLFSVSLGKGCRGLDFLAVSLSPSGDPMLRGRWECHVTDRDLARFLNTGLVSLAGQDPREGTVRVYDPKRCAAELQQCGELERACKTLVQQAFSLVLTVPGGVSLYFAGLIEHVGREVAWPQDIEEDRILREASIRVQRTWRGWSSRKRTLWLRMEREGRRRLARLQEKLKHKQSLEAKANVLQTERRIRAQIVLAARVRGRMARLERQRARRAEEHPQYEDPGVDLSESTGEEVTSTPITSYHKRHEMEHEGDERKNEESSPLGILGRDFVHFEKDVTIDGTEVRLIADVKEAGGTDNGRARVAEEMKLLAVDKKSRKSTTLTLEAADIRDIVGPVDRPTSASGGGWDDGAGASEAFAAVLKILTVFRSRRKDLFILSYKGKKVMAPH